MRKAKSGLVCVASSFVVTAEQWAGCGCGNCCNYRIYPRVDDVLITAGFSGSSPTSRSKKLLEAGGSMLVGPICARDAQIELVVSAVSYRPTPNVPPVLQALARAYGVEYVTQVTEVAFIPLTVEVEEPKPEPKPVFNFGYLGSSLAALAAYRFQPRRPGGL